MSRPIDVIVFSMSHYTDWQRGRVNRNYHIVEQLQGDERVGKVVTVDFLPWSWRKVAKIYWENIIRPMADLEIVYGDLTSACHKVNDRYFVYSTVDSIYAPQAVVGQLKRISRILNLKNVVLWSYHPMFPHLLERVAQGEIGHTQFVFDAVDNWLSHPAYAGDRERLRRGYDRIARDADVVFTVNQHLAKTLFSQRIKPTMVVPNGVDFDHFAADRPIPPALANLPRPIIGYHGIIESRFDAGLAVVVAGKMPEASFVYLGGNVWKSHRRAMAEAFHGLPNVHLLPFVSYQELPAYLGAFDAAFIPHQVNDLTASMDPLKFYEYCAAGVPVVTTPVAGTATFGSALRIARTADECVSQLRAALRDTDRASRQALVKPHSWPTRVDQMLNLILSSTNH
ncbi:MAG: glycosyltransferase [Patescibacteria group bacterium]